MKIILTHILFFFTVMSYAQTTPEESAKLKRERVKSRTILSENYDVNVVNEYQSWRKEEFDADGNLIVADILYFVRGLEQLLNRKEYFEYDSLRNVTLIRRVYSTYEESDQYTYTYDEKGNILKKQHDHFEDDRKTYTRFYEYAYNDDGLLMHRYCNLPKNLDSLKVAFYTFKLQKDEKIKVYRDPDRFCAQRV